MNNNLNHSESDNECPSHSTIVIPDDPLAAVFTPEVLKTWSSAKDMGGSLAWRINILSATGPKPTDIEAARLLRIRRAIKSAWATYLEAAFACGFFIGDKGTELRGRLQSKDDDGFRSAFSECLACWFFAGKMRLTVMADAPGRKARQLDMAIQLPDCRAGVEVKAPCIEPIPPGQFKWGDNSDKIAACFDQANRQLSDDSANILVITPQSHISLFNKRDDLVKAAYGETVIAFDFNANKGHLENHRWHFSPQGKFLGTKRPNGKQLKQDGFPAFRRISAIICIEPNIVEKIADPSQVAILASLAKSNRGELARLFDETRKLYNSPENEAWVDHNVLVMHNPYAYHPIQTELWNEFPQLMCTNLGIYWTDGHEISFG